MLAAPLLLAVALAVVSASPASSSPADSSIGAVVAWKPGQTEAALRKIDRAGLTVVQASDTRAVCQGKPSRARFVEELRNEPEIVYAFADVPCGCFVVSWDRSETEHALNNLKDHGVKVLHRGPSLPFAVCEGPLTADIQERLAPLPYIETVEPEAAE